MTGKVRQARQGKERQGQAGRGKGKQNNVKAEFYIFENEYKFDALAQCLNGVDGGGGGSVVVSVFVFTALWLFGGWQGRAKKGKAMTGKERPTNQPTKPTDNQQTQPQQQQTQSQPQQPQQQQTAARTQDQPTNQTNNQQTQQQQQQQYQQGIMLCTHLWVLVKHNDGRGNAVDAHTHRSPQPGQLHQFTCNRKLNQDSSINVFGGQLH